MPQSQPQPMGLALREIMGVLVHDVKNPLSSMITNAQFLRDDAPGDDARAAAEDVLAAAEWINRMLSNLSDIARFCEGDTEGVFGQADLVALLEAAEKTMIVHARDREVQIALGTQADSLPVNADPELLARVCETAIEACIRHAPKASSVVISAGRSKKGVEVSFRCHGSPFDDVERETLFTEEAFVGENSKRMRLAPNFGLAFCRRAARALGGDLVADPAPLGLLLRLSLPSA